MASPRVARDAPERNVTEVLNEAFQSFKSSLDDLVKQIEVIVGCLFFFLISICLVCFGLEQRSVPEHLGAGEAVRGKCESTGTEGH